MREMKEIYKIEWKFQRLTISKMKISLDRINSRLDIAKEKILNL